MSVIEKKLDELVEGDELAEDVLDDSGRLIIPKGNKLDSRLIQAIQSRNIEKIFVTVIELLSDDEIERKQKEIVERVDSKFRKVKGNALMKDLYEIILKHKLKNS